jgi:hypothetical protein
MPSPPIFFEPIPIHDHKQSRIVRPLRRYLIDHPFLQLHGFRKDINQIDGMTASNDG